MQTLIVVEHNHVQVHPNSLAVLAASQQLSDTERVMLIMGHNCQAVAKQAARIAGVDKVLCVDDPVLAHNLAEPSAEVIIKLAENYDYILAPASTFGKNILPRVAAKLDVGQISDVIQIIDNETFVRPMYAGNALATVRSKDHKKLLTVRASAFFKAEQSQVAVAIEAVEVTLKANHSQFIAFIPSESARPELATAEVIVSGGRGLQTKENFQLLEQLADKLNAAIGASRAAVDAGFVPNHYQIGQTGKIVAPALYIAIGISGAIQHLAGMKDSKVIVAINKDAEAPIMQMADYALVGDLFTIVPELIAALDKS